MQEKFRESVILLKDMLETLVNNVAGRIEKYYCDEAQEEYAKAAKLCKRSWEEPFDKAERFSEVLWHLVPVVNLLYDHEEIYLSKERDIQQNYETCLRQLTVIDILASTSNAGFKTLPGMEKYIVHPMIDEVSENLSRIYDTIGDLIEDPAIKRLSMVKMKRKLEQQRGGIEEAVSILDDFSTRGKAAEALTTKQKIVIELQGALKALMPADIAEEIALVEKEMRGRKQLLVLQKLQYVATEMSEIGKILLVHAGERKDKLSINHAFNYEFILPEKLPVDPMAVIRLDMLAASAKMAEIRPKLDTAEESELWDIAVSGLETAAESRKLIPSQISAFVERAMEAAEAHKGTGALLSRLQNIHEQLVRQSKNP